MKKERISCRKLTEDSKKFMEAIEEIVKSFESDVKKPTASRTYTVSACVTVEEKEKIDALCDELAEQYGRKLTRGALLRMVFLHFADNHEDICLLEYVD